MPVSFTTFAQFISATGRDWLSAGFIGAGSAPEFLRKRCATSGRGGRDAGDLAVQTGWVNGGGGAGRLPGCPPATSR